MPTTPIMWPSGTLIFIMLYKDESAQVWLNFYIEHSVTTGLSCSEYILRSIWFRCTENLLKIIWEPPETALKSIWNFIQTKHALSTNRLCPMHCRLIPSASYCFISGLLTLHQCLPPGMVVLGVTMLCTVTYMQSVLPAAWDTGSRDVCLVQMES